MKTIIVKSKNITYPIIIDHGLVDSLNIFTWPLTRRDVVVIFTNDCIASIYLDKLYTILDNMGITTNHFILPDGEEGKSLVVLDSIFTNLLIRNYDRNTVIIAFGGGVIGDVTGFAAATYQRGVRFIQIPTTLLAQVDASIGGKTGINHILGKNMIGCVYQPILVMIDLNYLYTLTIKEFSSGLSEVIKYAIIFDVCFFDWLEDNLDKLLDLNPDLLMHCVHRCCELKASVVAKDEYEQGIRSLLNLGHTFGHAIESYLKYKKWSHGESVSAGIMMAVNTALRLGKLINIDDAIRIKLLLKRAHLPVCGPKEMSPQDYIEYMVRDKKSRLGKINLVLPVSIGNSKIFFDVDHSLILDAIEDTYK